MTQRVSKFVVCHTLSEMLRMSPRAIDGLGMEFSLCYCRRCGRSLVISVDEATNATALDLEIICTKCAAPDSSAKPN